MVSARRGSGMCMWVCLQAKKHLAGGGGAGPHQIQLRAAVTPGGYPWECIGLVATISAIPPHDAQASLWSPTSVQALTITPRRSQAVAVLGAVIGGGHPSALQLPQCMDVEPQSLLLNWLSLPRPVLQDGRVCTKGCTCTENAMGLEPPLIPVPASQLCRPCGIL